MLRATRFRDEIVLLRGERAHADAYKLLGLDAADLEAAS